MVSTLSIIALISTLLLAIADAQDGFTWWVNPNSTSPIIFHEDSVITLEWVTDFPEFNIVLYQNLGDSYANSTSTYILGKLALYLPSGTRCETSDGAHMPSIYGVTKSCTCQTEDTSLFTTYDWTVAPVQHNADPTTLSFHFDITLIGNDANGANSQEFFIYPPLDDVEPTSTISDCYYCIDPTETVYAPYSTYPVVYDPTPYYVYYTYTETVTVAGQVSVSAMTVTAYEHTALGSQTLETASEPTSVSEPFIYKSSTTTTTSPTTAAGGIMTTNTEKSTSSTAVVATETSTSRGTITVIVTTATAAAVATAGAAKHYDSFGGLVAIAALGGLAVAL
ncbi:hypothetical protein MMC25_000530 [Agyrium rufum]|nr:hypothetical protein [Agyrium rufum]